jgi:hypothetical protein
MSPAGDVRDEMTNDSFDDAFDSLLAGRPVPVGAAPLVAFTNGLRAVAVRPGRPNQHLAELLATGLAPASAPAAVRPVPNPRSAQPSGRQRRRRTVFGFVAAAMATFASTGAVAQAATGLGIVLAGVTGAGAAGVLPGPIQGPVSSVLEAVTPFELPASADGRSTTDEEPATREAPQDSEHPAETPAQAEFGRQVSGEAQEGGVDGQAVSSGARDTHQPEVPATGRPVTAPSAPGRPDTDRPASADADAAPGSQSDVRPDAESGRP